MCLQRECHSQPEREARVSLLRRPPSLTSLPPFLRRMNSFMLFAGVALALLATQTSSLFLHRSGDSALSYPRPIPSTESVAGRDEEPSYHAPAPAPAPAYHRRRRDADEEKVAEMFAMVAKMDTHGCGMRLVCQLYQKSPQSLTLREKAIRLLIGEKPEPVAPKESRQPRALYQSAAVFGVRKENCLEIYHMCPLTNEEVMQYLNTLDLELK
ncbi:hypothetical protein C7M84_006941 [Penaeus vannamei]|uniref:Uncharacterized protein n=1 Tax=Penaeus vannamei TaxID=6689 RepID=A0A423TDN7_PENVA|nr:hypothetical protein C7M84_006941 [Penaeus vannamei]